MPSPPFDAIKQLFARHQNFLFATHIGPDGDAIGSALALKIGLEKSGKKVVYISRDGVPVSCNFLPHIDEVLVEEPPDFHPTCAVVLDCDGTPARVAGDYSFIERASERLLIDHHRGSLPIFEFNWLDPSKPATALMVFELLRAMEIEIDASMAQNLMTGLSCDTGHFRFSNTTPEVLAAAAHLVHCGASASEVSFKLFDGRSLASTKILALAIEKMQLRAGGRLAYTAISHADFLSVGTGDESVENVVNVLRNIEGVQMAVIFRERRDDEGLHARVSVRAAETLRADLFAREFGGGGHAAAAGLKHRGDFSAIVAKIADRAEIWMDEVHPALPRE